MHTAQKMKFSIMGFFSKSYQISRELRIRSYLLKKFLMENCAVTEAYFVPQSNINAVLYFRKNCP